MKKVFRYAVSTVFALIIASSTAFSASTANGAVKTGVFDFSANTTTANVQDISLLSIIEKYSCNDRGIQTVVVPNSEISLEDICSVLNSVDWEELLEKYGCNFDDFITEVAPPSVDTESDTDTDTNSAVSTETDITDTENTEDTDEIIVAPPAVDTESDTETDTDSAVSTETDITDTEDTEDTDEIIVAPPVVDTEFDTETDTDSNIGTETDVPNTGDSEDKPESSISEYEARVVQLVNEIRGEYGLLPLTINSELSAVARIKSQDMKDNQYFSHTSPVYGSPFDMMKSFGITYRTAGENIAMGQSTPEAVVNAWMNSEGHRANILNSSFTQIGVGYVAEGNYWTQMFIG